MGKNLASVLGILTTALAFSSSAQAIELTVFHTNDLHSHLHPPKGDEFGLGGLAKLSTLLNTLRSNNHTLQLTLDAGDWSEGTWYYNIDTGANMLRILDAMKYDATVVGNHDYFSGPDRLLDTVKNANPHFPVLAANFDFTNYPRKAEFENQIPPYAILERQELKIGLIGLTTNEILYTHLIKPLAALSPIKTAIQLARILRPQVDVLFVVSHNLFFTNTEIAKVVPGIDGVISGHTHKKVGKAVMVKNQGREIPVVETGSKGTFLGELHFDVDLEKHRSKFLSYRLHPVSPDLQEDPVISEIIAKEDQKLAQMTGENPNRIIGKSEIDLDFEDSHHAGLGDLAVKAFRKSAGTDLAFEELSLTGDKIPAGPLSVMNAHDVLPHLYNFATGKEWTVKVWNARGSDLKIITEIMYLPNIVPIRDTGFFAFDNLETTWKPKTLGIPFPQIVGIKIGGKDLDSKKYYTVAMTDAMVLALHTFNEKLHLGFDLSQITDTGIEAWRAILAYISEVKTITAEGLEEGGRSFTTLADPALYHYGVQYGEGGLSLEISNEGLNTSKDASVKCVSGRVNDSIAYKTEEEVFMAMGELNVPTLESRQSIKLRLPWKPLIPGLWPVKCELLAKEDGYSGNNLIYKIIQVE